MKTTNIIITTLLFSSMLVISQNEKKPVKVRMKKVENINGIEKVTDTTFTTTDYYSIDGIPEMEENEKKMKSQMEIITMNSNGEVDTKKMNWTRLEMEEQLTKALKEENLKSGERMIIDIEKENEGTENEKVGPKKYSKVIIIKHIDVVDLNDEELKLIGQNTSKADQKLELMDVNLIPNPSNGITGISLFLPKKGPTTIRVYNLNGQLIHEDHLNDFTGKYSKQLDLSAQPKGIYFLHVRQNNESVTKKIILE